MLSSENHKELEWYKDLSERDKSILESLREKQMELGAKKPLEEFPDPKRAVEIETKIDILFPESNFYFYDATKKE